LLAQPPVRARQDIMRSLMHAGMGQDDAALNLENVRTKF